MNKIITLLVFLIGNFLIACTSLQKEKSTQHLPPDLNKTNGFWEAKAQIRDLITQKSYQVNLDLTAVAPDRLRADVTGTMGISIASIVVNKNDVAYALFRQKKFFEGQATERALKPVFNIDMNPKTLLHICFDKNIDEPNWSCRTDEFGAVESCARQGGETIQWKDRSGEQKRVLVNGKTFELQMVFKSYSKLSTKVLNNPNVFHLETPNDFIHYKIP